MRFGLLELAIIFAGILLFLILLAGLVLLFFYLTRRPREEKEATKKCPYCAETIKADAIVCRFCGRDLTSSTQEN